MKQDPFSELLAGLGAIMGTTVWGTSSLEFPEVAEGVDAVFEEIGEFLYPSWKDYTARLEAMTNEEMEAYFCQQLQKKIDYCFFSRMMTFP